MRSQDRSLWLFRDLLEDRLGQEALEAALEEGRVERWGHDARIPLFLEGDEVILVVDGEIRATPGEEDEVVRLRPGDAFGPAVLSEGQESPEMVRSHGETTLCVIAQPRLRQLWKADQWQREVKAGGWFNKSLLEMPLWPLLGATATTRMARVLIHLVEEYGEIDGDRGRLPVALKPRQMAELAGLDRSQSRRVWGLFESSRLVEGQSGQVILTRLSKLRDYALGD